ncbi:MAG: branched-chain amino acid ABC transporter permease [Armatimonadota bacterium]|nr:branched-chain amino acid ABC transporter permease [Armatimonadota bacterium]MDR7447752.1 branched-chain amino acid ABC transporter permease [Armatimonadota bacterium]MDR7458529.1 branched-chain amino acid ABC transporter permease [Armatimonadota bacterium]MDR7479914.1 branched-chain amino acid ABC transporter permease [Armatimonadota bacterium]MDR7487738.1 branched-chain amino acid ABC transporter permease [Armatimonadota bacterium]
MLIFGTLRSGLYALAAVGLALSVGVIGIVNFAHGEFLMLGAYLGYWLFASYGVDPLAAIPLGAAGLFVLGGALYRTAIRRVLRAPELNQMLLTFGIAIFLQNLAVILWSGDPRTAAIPYKASALALGPFTIGLPQVVVFVLATGLTAALYALLGRTRVGKAMRAVAQDRVGSAIIGVEVDRIYLLAFGLSVALAGTAGLMITLQLSASPYMGLLYTLKAFAIIVIAGLGNIGAVVYASLVLGLAEAFVEFYVPNGGGWSEGVFFLLILLVLLVRPRGLFQ